MIPEATATVTCTIQSVDSSSILTSIGGPIIGGLIAGLIGLLAAEIGRRKEKSTRDREKEERRQWIARSVLTDLDKIKIFFNEFQDDNFDTINQRLLRIANAEVPQFEQIYSRTGVFFTHYPEVVNLGREIRLRVVLLYHNLDRIEKILDNMRSKEWNKIHNLEFSLFLDGTFHQIIEARRQVNELISILEPIVMD